MIYKSGARFVCPSDELTLVIRASVLAPTHVHNQGDHHDPNAKRQSDAKPHQ